MNYINPDISVLGVVTCAGNGGRFARSIGVDGPYPKHLQYLDKTTIMEEAVSALISMVPVDSIAITVNPEMLDPYLQEINRIAQLFPTIPFSYVPDVPITGAFGNKTLAQHIRLNSHNLYGTPLDVGAPLIAQVHGDVVLRIDDAIKLRQATEDALIKVASGERKMLVADPIFGGSILEIAQISASDDNKFTPLGFASDFGVRVWNINTIRDLVRAKRDLGYPLSEDELRLQESRRTRRNRRE